jgi:hypothetical protein
MRASRRIGLRRIVSAATSGPAYGATLADGRDIHVAGLAIPLRATVALFVATAAYVVDATGSPVGDWVAALVGRGDLAMNRALERAVVFGVAPLLLVVLAFRDPPDRLGRPSRYGLTVGDGRWGLGLLVAGIALMTPVIAWLSTFPEFVGYYGGAGGSLAAVALRNLVELVPTEFLLRGFLMFALLRRIGPLAIVIVQVPFVLTHIGKPEIELWSTFLGGSVFAWLNWRTRSIVWSALGHVYVLTLMVVLAGTTPP